MLPVLGTDNPVGRENSEKWTYTQRLWRSQETRNFQRTVWSDKELKFSETQIVQLHGGQNGARHAEGSVILNMYKGYSRQNGTKQILMNGLNFDCCYLLRGGFYINLRDFTGYTSSPMEWAWYSQLPTHPHSCSKCNRWEPPKLLLPP